MTIEGEPSVSKISLSVVVSILNCDIELEEFMKSSKIYPCWLFIGEQLYVKIKALINERINFIAYVF